MRLVIAKSGVSFWKQSWTDFALAATVAVEIPQGICGMFKAACCHDGSLAGCQTGAVCLLSFHSRQLGTKKESNSSHLESQDAQQEHLI